MTMMPRQLLFERVNPTFILYVVSQLGSLWVGSEGDLLQIGGEVCDHLTQYPAWSIKLKERLPKNPSWTYASSLSM